MDITIWIAVGLCLFAAVFGIHHGDVNDDKK